MKSYFFIFLIICTFKIILPSSDRRSLSLLSMHSIDSEPAQPKTGFPLSSNLTTSELTRPQEDDTPFSRLEREFAILQAEHNRLLKTMQDFIDAREEEIRRRTQEDRALYQRTSEGYFEKLREIDESLQGTRRHNEHLQNELNRTIAKLRKVERENEFFKKELERIEKDYPNIFLKTLPKGN